MQIGIESARPFAFRGANVTKCGLAFELDPYPRENWYSKAVDGKLRMDDVIRHLKEGICYIEFWYASPNDSIAKKCPTKPKGIRRMYGTKCANFIPHANKPSNPNADRFGESAIRVFDVQISEWRSFKLENVIIFRVKRRPYETDPSMERIMSNMQ